jgi:hypothetical protein
LEERWTKSLSFSDKCQLDVCGDLLRQWTPLVASLFLSASANTPPSSSHTLSLSSTLTPEQSNQSPSLSLSLSLFYRVIVKNVSVQMHLSAGLRDDRCAAGLCCVRAGLRAGRGGVGCSLPYIPGHRLAGHPRTGHLIVAVPHGERVRARPMPQSP